MPKSLLSHIADNFIREYENVANSSIAYLLNTYPAARKALKKRLDLSEIPVYFETEYYAKSNGRPDVVGKSAHGDIALIIEGKFWANLTDNQPGNYLDVLHANGKMLFLCPDRRIDSLRYEVAGRLKEPDGRLFYLSWNELLELIERENAKEYDVQLASDILQMKRLCDKMDEEGMPPISASDLSPMIGRVAYQFADLIDECNRIIKTWDESDFRSLKSTGSKKGYGFYFKAFGFGCRLEFSSYDWFKHQSQTPYWLYVWSEAFQKEPDAYSCLRIFDENNTYDESNFSLYGITLKAGMDRNQIVEHVADKTYEVLSFLHSCKEKRKQ